MKKGGMFGYVACLVIGAVVGVKYIAPHMGDVKLPDLSKLSAPSSVPSSLPTAPPSVKSALPKISWNAQSTSPK